ncbi:MAG: PAS domain-containing protein [Desulfobulbaceae bacterium]|nr:PAS domain-containing protein [Desulfobulbaceae bacterium]
MNLLRFRDISLKWKLVIPFFFLAIIGAASLFAVSYRFQNSLIHVNEAKRLRDQYQYFLDDIVFKENMGMSLAYTVAKNPDVAAAFAARDRDRLIELLLPVYETLHKDFGVKQFHFHIPPATSFLRLHALSRFGDDMESYRHTINLARQSGTGVSGIEAGVFGFGIRSVVPVFHEGRQIGTFEIGLSLEQSLLDEFKKNYGTDLLLYIREAPEVKSPKIFASTMEKGLLTTDFFNRCYDNGEVLIQDGKLGDRNLASITGPIRDFSTRVIAVVEISVDRSPTLALLKQYRTITSGIVALYFVFSIIFVWCVCVIFVKRIHKVVKASEEIAAGQRDTMIPEESADELGTMARSINKLLSSLEASRKRLKNYSHNLEVMVDQRTRTLKESERTYRTLVENVPLIVYMISADGAVVFLNKAVEQMMGMSPEQLNGHHSLWDEHLHPDDRARVVARREECLRKGKDLHIDYRMIHKDHHIVYGVEHAVAVYDGDNEFMRMDGIVIDVTIQKELQEKILQSEELETLSQVSARMAHELRNPLTAIGGLTRRLIKSFDESDPRNIKGELIIEQVEKLERILLMMLAYIGPQSVLLQPAELNTVVLKAVDTVRSEYPDKDFSVKASFDERIPQLQLDPSKLKTVLINLMENAYHRMGQKGDMNVTTRKIGEHAAITLSYRVPFISDDDIKDFFYPFAVAYPFAKGATNGDIMDVPIAKVVIHNHGGIINVGKEDDNVVWIDISLPLKLEASAL